MDNNKDYKPVNTNKVKEWRAERDEWMGETVEIEWKCVYHKPDDRRARQVARPELIKMKIYEEEEEEEKGEKKDTKKEQK